MTRLNVVIVLLVLARSSFALTAQPTRLTLWKSSEAIGGEAMIAANENVLDYMSTLRRPTSGLKGITYHCMARLHTTSTWVTGTGMNPGGTVSFNTVYQLSDCTETR